MAGWSLQRWMWAPLGVGAVAVAVGIGIYLHRGNRRVVTLASVLANPPRSDLGAGYGRPCARGPGPPRPTTAGLTAALRSAGVPVQAWRPAARSAYGWAVGRSAVGYVTGTSTAAQRQVGLFVIGAYRTPAAARRVWRATRPKLAGRLADLHLPAGASFRSEMRGDLVVFHLFGRRRPQSSLDGELVPVVDQCLGLAMPALGMPLTHWPGQIAYAAPRHDLYQLPNAVYTVRSGTAPRLLRSWPLTAVTAIAISPDGSRIAVALNAPGTSLALWVMSATGHDMRALVRGWRVSGLDWSADGKLIAATGTKPLKIDGPSHLLVITVADGAVRDLTPGGVSATFPAWVPNRHDLLSFAVAHSGASVPNSVGLISASGTGFQRVTSFGAQYLAWYANPHKGFLFEAQGGLYGPAGTLTAVVQHCRAAFNCGDMEPLTLLDGDRLVGFVTTFANNRQPEVDVAPVTTGTVRRVLVEPYGACCTAWWPGRR